MPWPVYTERFLHHQAGGTWSWTCPPARRAILTNVSVLNTLTTAPMWVSLSIGGIYVTLIFPAANATIHQTLKGVLYQGETLNLTISQSGLHVTVSGYLMADASGHTGPPGQTSYERLHAPTPLPSLPPELLPGTDD
jgi:hypothetical protein